MVSPADVELLKFAKKYLKSAKMLKEAERDALPLAVPKQDWQTDSTVTECNGCQKRFGEKTYSSLLCQYNNLRGRITVVIINGNCDGENDPNIYLWP